jgi:hypothetical protein
MCTVCGCSDTKMHDHGHSHGHGHSHTGIPTGMIIPIRTHMMMGIITMITIITAMAATCISEPAPPVSMWQA